MIAGWKDVAKLGSSLCRLIRIRTGVLIALATVGAAFASGITLSWKSAALAWIFFCLSSAGFAINDYYDLEVDAKAHRDRPLPAGELKRQTALKIAIAFFSAAILTSFLVGKKGMILTATDAGLLMVYSAYVKGSGKIDFLGAAITGLLCASIFFGAWAGGAEVSAVWLPAMLVFFFIVGREIILDMRDVKSDESSGMKTIPALLGNQGAAIVSAVMFSVFLISSPLPYLAHTTGIIYLIGTAVVDGVLVVTLWKLVRNPSQAEITRAVNVTKVCFIIGILAVALGSVV